MPIFGSRPELSGLCAVSRLRTTLLQARTRVSLRRLDLRPPGSFDRLTRVTTVNTMALSGAQVDRWRIDGASGFFRGRS